MKNIYYFASQVYQYAHAKPIYDRTGGTFIVNRLNRAFRFKYYLRNSVSNKNMSGFFGAPKVIKRNNRELHDLEGIIISGENSRINYDKKKSISIFIGHGTGDKKYGGPIHILENYDYHFLSGPKHIQKQKDVGLIIPEEKLVKIGYPKFDDYINGNINKKSYSDLLGIKDQNRKNVLYAPTWVYGDGTLKKYGKKFIRELDKDYNLIIRPHFYDRGLITNLKFWAKYHGYKNVYFSNPAKLLKNNSMNDFAISDIMVSDTSSIMYEYLVTSNPIIIVENNYDQLHNMPPELSILDVAKKYNGESSDICQMINDALENNKTRKIYNDLLNNCFYYNDGKSTERAVDFIKSMQK